MDTENLRTYLSVVRFCNFTRAAEQLFVAQSTVTNRILELEREAGVRLLRRDTRNFSLTEEGKLFAEYARRIVELEDALKAPCGAASGSSGWARPTPSMKGCSKSASSGASPRAAFPRDARPFGGAFRTAVERFARRRIRLSGGEAGGVFLHALL